MPNELPLYVTYEELEQIAQGVEETNENYQKINLGIKYFRDIAQEAGTGSWHKPQVDVIGLTTGDIWEIATFKKRRRKIMNGMIRLWLNSPSKICWPSSKSEKGSWSDSMG